MTKHKDESIFDSLEAADMVASGKIVPVTGNTTVAVGSVGNFDDELLKTAMAEELDGLGQIQLPRIRVPAGGSISFEVPTDDPEDPQILKELRGVIIAHHPVNRLYLKSVEDQTEQGAAPDCYSNDGKTGSVAFNEENGYGGLCESCPMNEFGSGRGGTGKMCSNRHRILFMLSGGQGFPFILETPPASLKNLKQYISNLLLLSKRTSWSVETAITLKKVQGEKTIYSELQFKKIRDLTFQEAVEMKELGEQMKAIS